MHHVPVLQTVATAPCDDPVRNRTIPGEKPMMTRFKRLESALLTLGTLALAMPAAQARFVFVDFGDPVSFATDGQLFTQPLSTGGTVPFQLNFGQGTNTYDYCYSGTGGFVQFVGSGNPCAAGPVPAPGSNYIA